MDEGIEAPTVEVVPPKGTVMTALTVEQRAEIGDKLASLVEQIKGIKAEAKSKAFAYREEVERLQEEQERLAAQMILGLEEKSQLDLTFPQEQAAQALHDIAAKACTCKSPGMAEMDCPLHGPNGSETKAEKADRGGLRIVAPGA